MPSEGLEAYIAEQTRKMQAGRVATREFFRDRTEAPPTEFLIMLEEKSGLTRTGCKELLWQMIGRDLIHLTDQLQISYGPPRMPDRYRY